MLIYMCACIAVFITFPFFAVIIHRNELCARITKCFKMNHTENYKNIHAHTRAHDHAHSDRKIGVYSFIC